MIFTLEEYIKITNLIIKLIRDNNYIYLDLDFTAINDKSKKDEIIIIPKIKNRGVTTIRAQHQATTKNCHPY